MTTEHRKLIIDLFKNSPTIFESMSEQEVSDLVRREITAARRERHNRLLAEHDMRQQHLAVHPSTPALTRLRSGLTVKGENTKNYY